jgi:hypothetical protein
MEIDVDGNMRVMKRDVLVDSPKFFIGLMNHDTMSRLKDLLEEHRFDSSYQIKPTSSYLYCGRHYSLESKLGKQSQLVLFIPPEAPLGLNVIADLLERQLTDNELTPTTTFSLSEYERKINLLDLRLYPQPPQIDKTPFTPLKVRKDN